MFGCSFSLGAFHHQLANDVQRRSATRTAWAVRDLREWNGPAIESLHVAGYSVTWLGEFSRRALETFSRQSEAVIWAAWQLATGT
jgi:hypothetical protein